MRRIIKFFPSLSEDLQVHSSEHKFRISYYCVSQPSPLGGTLDYALLWSCMYVCMYVCMYACIHKMCLHLYYSYTSKTVPMLN